MKYVVPDYHSCEQKIWIIHSQYDFRSHLRHPRCRPSMAHAKRPPILQAQSPPAPKVCPWICGHIHCTQRRGLGESRRNTRRSEIEMILHPFNGSLLFVGVQETCLAGVSSSVCISSSERLPLWCWFTSWSQHGRFVLSPKLSARTFVTDQCPQSGMSFTMP